MSKTDSKMSGNEGKKQKTNSYNCAVYRLSSYLFIKKQFFHRNGSHLGKQTLFVRFPSYSHNYRLRSILLLISNFWTIKSISCFH